MADLLSQCPEILHNILRQVDPEDLANISKSCRALNYFIRHDRLLWKAHYLTHFDPIPRLERATESDWQAKLHELIALKKLLMTENVPAKKDNLAKVAPSILELLTTSSIGPKTSLNIDFLTTHFSARPTNVDVFLCSSSLFNQVVHPSSFRSPAPTQLERQLSARLHVLYGASVESAKRHYRPIHPYARAKVYDLRRYNDDNLWGPFLDDGSQGVDWEKVEAIMVVLGYNLRVFSQRMSGIADSVWEEPWVGTAEGSFRSPPSIAPSSIPAEPALPLDLQDPYGVTGTWRRIVCFLNYTDLYALNFESSPLPLDQDRPPISTQEAIRFIVIKIRVTRITPPGPEDGQDLPVVHFAGTSRSLYMSWDPNANSRIRGTVRLTRGGSVRWTTFSIYHGYANYYLARQDQADLGLYGHSEERWRSEGVQIGGLRSGRGILGTWFDKDYDTHGPAGPTAFWKVTDEIEEDKVEMESAVTQIVFL